MVVAAETPAQEDVTVASVTSSNSSTSFATTTTTTTTDPPAPPEVVAKGKVIPHQALTNIKTSFLKLKVTGKELLGTTKQKIGDSYQTARAKMTDETSKPKNQPPSIIVSDTKDDALLQLQALIEAAKVNSDKNNKNNNNNLQKWNFDSLPLECFEATLDDVLRAFVQWSLDDTQQKYNVTKAFARLEQYATWMDRAKLGTITTESVQDAWKAWAMKASYDKNGRFVWWIDLSVMDMTKVKKDLSASESLRLFVWFAHFCMLDRQAQEHGMVLCENLNHAGFWSSLTLIPPQLGMKIDRLTVGTLPIKMKKVYIVQSPKWATRMMAMMKPFMSAKVKARIVTMEIPAMLEDELGLDCIPTDFSGCQGKMAMDLVQTKYFANVPNASDVI